MRLTCDDVLGHDFDVHLQWVFGGEGDLSCHMGNLTDEDRRQEFCLLHPNQSCQTSILDRVKKKTFNLQITLWFKCSVKYLPMLTKYYLNPL